MFSRMFSRVFSRESRVFSRETRVFSRETRVFSRENLRELRTREFMRVRTRVDTAGKSVDRLNAFSQNIHLKGFSPIWLRLCFAKVEESLNAFSQKIHFNGFSPV